MSAKAGWYPDPGGGVGLFRYWDGKAWSAATSPHPGAAPPPTALGPPQTSMPGSGGMPYGQQPYGSMGSAGHPYGGQGQGTAYGGQGQGAGYGGHGHAYADYTSLQKRRSPIGWWVAAAALLVVIVVVAVIAIRAATGGGGLVGDPPVTQPSEQVCPPPRTVDTPPSHPEDGRVHGGPVSYPRLGSPWEAPHGDDRVPFGVDVQTQTVTVEPNYDGQSHWVASVLVGELQAGDGFFTPEQGAAIVVKCILGKFYGDNPVRSDVKVNKAVTIDGHDAWLVESQLSFDIPGLRTKGELLIVAIVSTGATAGLYYASIPDTTPELVAPARQVLAALQVDP